MDYRENICPDCNADLVLLKHRKEIKEKGLFIGRSSLEKLKKKVKADHKRNAEYKKAKMSNPEYRKRVNGWSAISREKKRQHQLAHCL